MVKKATFFLDKPKSNTDTHLFLKFTCNDGVLKYSMKIKLHPSTWDSENQLSKTDRKINSEINRLFGAVERYTESCRIIGKEVLVEELRAELNGNTGRKERRKHLNLFHYVDVLINEAKAGKLLTPSRTKYTLGTIKNWIKSKERLEEFNPELTFDEITLETYNSFIKFCNDRSYAKSYTGKLIKDFKTFMSISHVKGWHTNLVYKHPEFKKLREASFQVYLDEKEIENLYKFDLSKTPNLETIRDRFIIGLFTGFRISDMQLLTEENISEGNIVQINHKTGKKVVIPIHPYIQEIIHKYKGLPYQYTDVTVNRSIKEIARMVGFNEKIRFTKTIGGVKKEFVKPKWQMISNHTVRRSMATNLLKYTDAIDAMQVLGMSLKTLETYNKRSPEENAEMLKKNPFFNKK